MSQNPNKQPESQEGAQSNNQKPALQGSSLFSNSGTSPFSSFAGKGTIFTNQSDKTDQKPPIFGGQANSSLFGQQSTLFGAKSDEKGTGSFFSFNQPSLSNPLTPSSNSQPQSTGLFNFQPPKNNNASPQKMKEDKVEDNKPSPLFKKTLQQSVPFELTKKIENNKEDDKNEKQEKQEDKQVKKNGFSQSKGGLFPSIPANSSIFSAGNKQQTEEKKNLQLPKNIQSQPDNKPPQIMSFGLFQNPEKKTFSFTSNSRQNKKEGEQQIEKKQQNKKEEVNKVEDKKEQKVNLEQKEQKQEKGKQIFGMFGKKEPQKIKEKISQFSLNKDPISLKVPNIFDKKDTFEIPNAEKQQSQSPEKQKISAPLFGNSNLKNMIPTPKKTQSIQQVENFGRKRSPKRKKSDDSIKIMQKNSTFGDQNKDNKAGGMFNNINTGGGNSLFSNSQSESLKKGNQKTNERKEENKKPSISSNSGPLFSANNTSISSNNESKVSQSKEYFALQDLEDILIFGEKSDLDKNQTKITNTLIAFLKVSKNSDSEFFTNPRNYFKKKSINDEGYQKLLNDITLMTCSVMHIDESAFILVKNELKRMLEVYKLEQMLAAGKQMTDISKFCFYTSMNSGLVFNEESEKSVQIVAQFMKFYTSRVLKCLKALTSRRKDPIIELLFHKTKVFENLFEICLLMSLKKPKTQNKQIYSVCREADELFMDQLLFILHYFNKPSKNPRLSTSSLDHLFPLIDEAIQQSIVELSQKILLNSIDLRKLKQTRDRHMLDLIQKTRNNVFLPFRAILSKIDPNRKEIRPFASELFKHINGSEWFQWLDLYLMKSRNERDTFMVVDKQIPFIIKALSTMKINFTSPLFSSAESNILKLIRNLRQENKRYFYEAICSIMNDSQSVLKIEGQFKLGGAQIFSELRQLTEEIMKYPHCCFDTEDLPELRSKAIYFLTNIKLIPDRVFDFEDQFFQSQGFVDNQGEHCDRVCHLILDLLNYFSLLESFDEDIIIGVFQAIVIMMKRPNIKPFMSLAMNVNKPSLEFFNRTLSDKLVSAISNLTAFLLDSEQFYDSVRTSDQTISLLKAYPFRYQPNKSFQFTKDIQYTIPEYWFSNCLNALVKQNYNPELLDKMLCKLKLTPSSNDFTAKASLLDGIVNACNRCSFWKDLMSTLEVTLSFTGNSVGVFNQIILTDTSRYFYVHQSLRLLKTMLQLKEIYEKSQKTYRLHIITCLLANLRCLSELNRFINPIVNEKTLRESKNNTILLLVSLIGEESRVFNESAFMGSELRFPDIDLANNQVLIQEYRQVAKSIDYSILKDPLTWPKNKYLENLECIGSYSLKILNYILTKCPDISIQATLYTASQSTNQAESNKRMQDLKQQLHDRFLICLSSAHETVTRNAWQVLVTMRKHEKNKNLSRQIFKNFCQKKRRSISNVVPLQFLAQFLKQQASQQYFQSDKIVCQLMQSLKDMEIENLNELLQKYEDGHEGGETIIQFDRIITERKMMNVVDYYDKVRIMCDYILQCIYKQNIMGAKYSSMMMEIISNKKFLSLFSQQVTVLDQDLDRTLPRCYGLDVLECFLSNQSLNRSTVLSIQISNVVRWCNIKLQLLNKAIMNFITIILSIDQTFYANHPVSIKDRKHSNFFCELHIPPSKHSAIQLVGSNQDSCLDIISNYLQACIDKIGNLKIYGMSSEIIACFSVIDVLLCWLYQQLKHKVSRNSNQLNQFCIKILSTCYEWLGGAVNDSIVNKLLITIIICGEGRLSSDMQKMIKQTIHKTIISLQTPSLIKQQILPLLIMIPPLKHERYLIEQVARLWATEEANQYFYNQSRVLLKMSEIYPIEVAKCKIFSKCLKLKTLHQFHLQRDRYEEGCRKSEMISWVWALKIGSTLLQNGGESPIVVSEVNRLIKEHKKRILFVLNEPRLVIEESNRFHKEPIIQISMAQLQELQAVLQLVATASMCKMWTAMENQIFQEFLFALQHRTILLFVQNSMNSELKKRYIPQSDNQKTLWEMFPIDSYGHKTHGFTYNDSYIDEEYQTKTMNPSIFIFSMTLKFQACLRAWAVATSIGLKKSCFVRQFFSKPITTDTIGGVYKYTLTHWDHLNKAICELIENQGKHVIEWMRWEKKEGMLSLLNDVFKSGEMFTESGYLNTTQSYPQNSKQLFDEITSSVGLLLELGSCHLICQIHFKKLKGTISRDSLKTFRQKLSKLSESAREKLRRVKMSDQDMQAIDLGKEYLEEAQLAF